MYIFWCKLENGRENSISTDNLYDAPRRARALNATKLFAKNTQTGDVFEVAI